MTTGRDRKTILIVEDEPAVLGVLAASLEQAGYSVLAADGPERAMALFEQRQAEIALLLTDVVMPGMNGADLADRLVALRPQLRILCIAGMPDTPIVKYLVQRGYAFLPKPFLPPELTRKVAEVLRAPRLARAASSA